MSIQHTTQTQSHLCLRFLAARRITTSIGYDIAVIATLFSDPGVLMENFNHSTDDFISTQELDAIGFDPTRHDEEPLPPRYNEPHSVKELIARSTIGLAAAGFAVVIAAGVMIATATLAVPTSGILLAMVIATFVVCGGALAVYREYWRWRHERITCDPMTGILEVHEAENRWLAIRGSAPDPYELDDYTLITPTKSWLELYVFRRTQTLELMRSGTVAHTLRNVVDVERIIAIARHWSSLKAQEIEKDTITNNLLADILDELRHTRTELSMIRQHLDSPTGEQQAD